MTRRKACAPDLGNGCLIVFTPVTPPPGLPRRRGPGRTPRLIYEMKGEASLSGLIAGLISASSVVAPTGFEPVFAVRHALS